MNSPTTVTWNDDPDLLFLDWPIPWQKQRAIEIMSLASRLRQACFAEDYDRAWNKLQDAVYALMPPMELFESKVIRPPQPDPTHK